MHVLSPPIPFFVVFYSIIYPDIISGGHGGTVISGIRYSVSVYHCRFISLYLILHNLLRLSLSPPPPLITYTPHPPPISWNLYEVEDQGGGGV